MDQRVLFKFRESWPTGNRLNRALSDTQKISPGSPAVATAPIALEICHAQTMYSKSVLDFTQIGSLSAEL